MIHTIIECDKLRENTIIVNGIRELAMTKATAYQKKEIKNSDGMKVYFEFPEPTENDEQIKKEVADILTNTLLEQMKKIS
jgi:hypothetical protein